MSMSEVTNMPGNIQYWAVSGRSFRAINSEEDLLPGESLAEGEQPTFPPDHVVEAETQRAQLLSEANAVTADWRTELALGMLSEDDEAKLKEWMLHIKAVKTIDTSTAPDITWPAYPSQ